MLIAQITDLHLRSDNLPLWGEVDTVHALLSVIDHINALHPAPDVVLATGDLVDQPSPKAYKLLKKLLKGLKAPCYLIPGNHDDRALLLAAFGKKRAPYFDRRRSHLSYVIDDFPLRLIGLDSTEPGDQGGRICKDRAHWLDQVLAKAPDTPTLLFMHHPPFNVGIAHMDRMGFKGSDRLGDIITKHQQVIQIITGHMHRPIQSNWQGRMVSICPSAAFQLQFTPTKKQKVSVSREPAMVGLYRWTDHPDPFGTIMAHLNPVYGG